MRIVYISPFKLAPDIAEIRKALRITPSLKSQLSRTTWDVGQNTPLSNIVTTSSPNILSWENAEDACLDWKSLMYPHCRQLF